MCISPLALLIIFIFFVVEWKVHQDYMTLTTILFLPSNLTNITTPFKRTNKENNNSTESFRCRFPIHGPDSDLRSRVTVPIPITAARTRFPILIDLSIQVQQQRIVRDFRLRSAPIRFAISDSDSRSRVTVPIPITAAVPIRFRAGPDRIYRSVCKPFWAKHHHVSVFRAEASYRLPHEARSIRTDKSF